MRYGRKSLKGERKIDWMIVMKKSGNRTVPMSICGATNRREIYTRNNTSSISVD